MNYRHGFHAGNHADVLKHLALVFCLAHLNKKPAPFAVLDTHAGRGLYDLTSAEAQRSPEWRDGIGKLADAQDAPSSVRAFLDAVAPFQPAYPGSPALIAASLRAQDRYAACELHPEEHAALKRALRGIAHEGQAQVHERDGWGALAALLPLPERRGLVLIDPPYEAPDELETGARAIQAALARFGHGVFVWWRPLKQASLLDRVDAELGTSALRADLWIDAPQIAGKLVGSSLFVINPPYGLGGALAEALPYLAAKLALSPGAGWRLDDPDAPPEPA